MDFSSISICRMCLSSKYLTPIFEDEDHQTRVSSAIYITTGLKVEINDGLPQQMCKRCSKLLNNSLKFRQQCKDAETHLLSIQRHNENGCVLHSEVKLKRKQSKEDKNDDIKTEKPTSDNDDEIPLKSLLQKIVPSSKLVKIETQYLQIETNDNQDKNLSDPITDSIKTENATSIDTEKTTNDNQDKNLSDPITDSIKTENATSIDTEKTTNDNQDKNLSDPITDSIKTENAMSIDTEKTIEHIDDSEEIQYVEEYLDPQFELNSETEEKVLVKDEKDALLNISLNNVTDTETMPYIVHDLKRVTCKLCQKDLSRRSIDFHIAKRHPGADARKVKCDLCDTYVLRSRLNRHKVLIHGHSSFKCKYCKTKFENEVLLVAHVPLCTAKKSKSNSADTAKRKELKVECDICHKVMQKASLRIHKNIKHAGMRPVCEHCGRRFGNKYRLSEHLRAKHGYEKFKCSMCDFLSASTMALRNHERRHRGEKPFSCDTCPAKFHAPSLLAQHKQSHRTERLMKCDQCPAAFKANNTLHTHKMTCHNAYRYQCPMCPRTYSCRHYVVKHMRAVHRVAAPVGLLHRGRNVTDHTSLVMGEL